MEASAAQGSTLPRDDLQWVHPAPDERILLWERNLGKHRQAGWKPLERVSFLKVTSFSQVDPQGRPLWPYWLQSKVNRSQHPEEHGSIALATKVLAAEDKDHPSGPHVVQPRLGLEPGQVKCGGHCILLHQLSFSGKSGKHVSYSLADRVQTQEPVFTNQTWTQKWAELARWDPAWGECCGRGVQFRSFLP